MGSGSARRARNTGKGATRAFFKLEKRLLDDPRMMGLTGPATKVLLHLMSQFRGSNNGDLSATHTQVQAWEINSKTTLRRALDELIEADLIIQTRDGRFQNPGGRCALFALTWLGIDECPGKDLEVRPNPVPMRPLSYRNTGNAGSTIEGTTALEKTESPVQDLDPVGTDSGTGEAGNDHILTTLPHYSGVPVSDSVPMTPFSGARNCTPS